MANGSIETNERFVLYSYRIGRPQLERLFAVATEGTTSPTRVTVKTTVGRNEFKYDSLDSLVTAVAGSATPCDPTNWDNLDLHAFWYGENGDQSQSVFIKFEREKVTISVYGGDSTWVLGKGARIREIIESTGASETEPWPKFLRTASLIGGFVGLVSAAAAFAILTDRGGHFSFQGTDIFACILIGFLVSFVYMTIAANPKRMPRPTVLNVETNVTHQSWWEGPLLPNKIAFWTLVGTLIAAVAAVASVVVDIVG